MGFEAAMLADIIFAAGGAADAHHGHSTLPFKIALIGALGIGAQWLAWKLQRPAIVLMAIAGLIFGPLVGFLMGFNIPGFSKCSDSIHKLTLVMSIVP